MTINEQIQETVKNNAGKIITLTGLGLVGIVGYLGIRKWSMNLIKQLETLVELADKRDTVEATITRKIFLDLLKVHSHVTMIGYINVTEPTFVEVGYDSRHVDKYKGQVVGVFSITDAHGNLLVEYGVLKSVPEFEDVEDIIAECVEESQKMWYSELTLPTPETLKL